MAEVFYEEFIKKRELKKKWISYWAMLKDDKMYLYVSRDCKDVEFCEIIWLPRGSRCILLKRRTYSFRFRLNTSDGNHYFKCDSNLQRHRWIHMIHLATSGRLPESPPNHIDMRCCYTGHEKQAMDIVNSSNWKSSSLEKIVEDSRIIEEASEEKEDVEQSDDVAPETCVAEEIENNNTGGIDMSGSLMSSSRESLEFKAKNEVIHSPQCENSPKESEINPNESLLFDNLPDVVEPQSTVDKEESPAIARQTWSFKTFTFGSLRKSLRRQRFPPKKESKSAGNNDETEPHLCQKDNEAEKGNFSTRFSMDNPAFTDDDTEESEEQEGEIISSRSSRIINVSPCDELKLSMH